MKNTILISLLLISLKSFSQETFTIMQYNLTYYGNTASLGCTNANNSVTNKNVYLKKIIDYVNPDIFSVNEMGFNVNYVNSLRDNALNVNGRDYFFKTKLDGFGDIINFLYFNVDKFGIHSEDLIDKELDGDWITRPIDVITLYYKAPDLAETNDTVFLSFIVAHLKAGSSASDETKRADATEAVMSYLDNNTVKGYHFFMGDLNVKTSDADAYQNLINYSNTDLNFVDPINEPGNWSANSSFASIHTQSTRENDSNDGCFVTGGLDDRYDFILMDNAMEDASSKVKYISGTYKALGNDGAAYNSDVRISNNSVVPDTIGQALYEVSDHLPVVMDIEIGSATGINDLSKKLEYNFTNPIQDEIIVRTNNSSKIRLTLVDITGKSLIQTSLSSSVEMNVSNLSNGIYLLKIEDERGNHIVEKVVK